MKKHIFVAFVALTTSASVFSKDLSFSIRADRKSFKVGEPVAFTFVYTNTSTHDIGIYPEYYAYEALDTYFVKLESDKKGEIVRYLSPPYFDCAVVAKKFRVLRSRETYTRHLTATVSRSLPNDVNWLDRTPSLYLVFADSAIKLPGFGAYNVTSCYLSSETWERCLSNETKKQLWIGKVCTPPLTIEVHEK